MGGASGPSSRRSKFNSTCSHPSPAVLPLSPSSHGISVWAVVNLPGSTCGQHTTACLVPLLFPTLSFHFPSMWQSGLPSGISGQHHVPLMDPVGMLPELQALNLLAQESYFLPCGAFSPCFKETIKLKGGEKGVNQRADRLQRFQDKQTCCWCHNTKDLELLPFFKIWPQLGAFLMTRSDKTKSDFFISMGCWECFSIVSLQGRDSLCTEVSLAQCHHY